MRLFLYELKKIWNVKVLLVIAAFAVLTWLALLSGAIDTFYSLQKHGSYGSFQTEMFRLYGSTLEAEELADFDIPGRLAEINAEVEAKGLIKNEPAFAKYGITDMYEYENNRSDEEFWNGMYPGEDMYEEIMEDFRIMNRVLSGGSLSGQTLEEWYASPEIRWSSLRALEQRYANQEYLETFYVTQEHRPVVSRAAAILVSQNNNSLICGYLLDIFSLSAAVTGVFTVAAVIVLIVPPLVNDKARKINMLQYSSAAGRKILRLQFIAALVSGFALSLIFVVLFLLPLLNAGGDYRNTSIFYGHVPFIWMYDITFGQYTLLLMGMIIASCVGAAGFAFILARFSGNIVSVMIKAVPAGAALCVLTAYAVNLALADMNFFFNAVFGGRAHMPEVIVCGVIGLAGVAAAAVVVKREKRVNLI